MVTSQKSLKVPVTDFMSGTFWIKDSNDRYFQYNNGLISCEDNPAVEQRVVAVDLSSCYKFTLLAPGKGFYDEKLRCAGNVFRAQKACRFSFTNRRDLCGSFLSPDGHGLIFEDDVAGFGEGKNLKNKEVMLNRISQVDYIPELASMWKSKFGNVSDEKARFSVEVQKRLKQEEPVLINFGCGLSLRPGFLNVDLKLPSQNLVEPEMADCVFMFPVGDVLPLPANSVDFIINEDFIEHLPQKVQLSFLAECLRVLKPMGVIRVNTPDLSHSMKINSNFEKGAAGVYFGEWERWGHEVVLTQSLLRDMAIMIGYRDIKFLTRDISLSFHHPGDIRPKGDRSNEGNLFADLQA